ncbi:hypothetical protein INT45_009508 [Circinella minor]|uniref:Uncharacterized protein n=1 Tax=Circinella minor TaxID=1195481 RepID=A0A8H7S7Q0_9FUNG|nr:hypothetical protein INT45_009508 [Circinella minor]
MEITKGRNHRSPSGDSTTPLDEKRRVVISNIYLILWGRAFLFHDQFYVKRTECQSAVIEFLQLNELVQQKIGTSSFRPMINYILESFRIRINENVGVGCYVAEAECFQDSFNKTGGTPLRFNRLQ